MILRGVEAKIIERKNKTININPKYSTLHIMANVNDQMNLNWSAKVVMDFKIWLYLQKRQIPNNKDRRGF